MMDVMTEHGSHSITSCAVLTRCRRPAQELSHKQLGHSSLAVLLGEKIVVRGNYNPNELMYLLKSQLDSLWSDFLLIDYFEILIIRTVILNTGRSG